MAYTAVNDPNPGGFYANRAATATLSARTRKLIGKVSAGPTAGTPNAYDLLNRQTNPAATSTPQPTPSAQKPRGEESALFSGVSAASEGLGEIGHGILGPEPELKGPNFRSGRAGNLNEPLEGDHQQMTPGNLKLIGAAEGAGLDQPSMGIWHVPKNDQLDEDAFNSAPPWLKKLMKQNPECQTFEQLWASLEEKHRKIHSGPDYDHEGDDATFRSRGYDHDKGPKKAHTPSATNSSLTTHEGTQHRHDPKSPGLHAIPGFHPSSGMGSGH